jgi:isoquinoline 1-oxidoreductase beta subunit
MTATNDRVYASARGLTRHVLLRGGALVLSAAMFPSEAIPAPSSGNSRAASLTAWVRIGQNNSVTLIASQSEMGQGSTTTLAAALGDELYLSLDAVRIEFAPFAPAYRDPVYNWMFTGNSQSMSSFYDVMRQMGAAAREMLLTAAAGRWKTPVNGLNLRDGRIFHQDGRRTLTYGEVAADAAKLPVPGRPALRAQMPSAGRALRRWDIPGKVDGSAEFGIDVKIPGMLLAAVRCAPRFGARLEKYDAAAIRSKPGVVAVVEIPDGLAVAANTYWQARRALDDAVLTCSDEGSEFTSAGALDPIYARRLAEGPFFTHLQVGAPADVPDTSRKLGAIYQIPFQAHATMEPMNCTALLEGGYCEIWAPRRGSKWRKWWPRKSPVCPPSGSPSTVPCSAADSVAGCSPTSSSRRFSLRWR